MEFCQWLQSTPWSTWLRESTWSYPILAAVHVLGLAWFGGAVLKDLPTGKRMGLVFMTVTGAVLFYMSPVHCYQSYAFRAKMLLLVAAVVQTVVQTWAPWSSLRSGLSPSAAQAGTPILSLAYWAGMIFAARGIAFF